MHPALGLGEDWNPVDLDDAWVWIGLHPALGLGEDWNIRSHVGVTAQDLKLHPALGLGEDWNTNIIC